LSDESPRSYEIRHLARFHPIALAHLGWTNAHHLARANGEENSGPIRCELKRVAIAARHQDRVPAPLFRLHGGGQEIIGFLARRFGIDEAARRNELRQKIELFDQRVIKRPAALVRRELFVAVGLGRQCIPPESAL
jgi:hypothetical protein